MTNMLDRERLFAVALLAFASTPFAADAAPIDLGKDNVALTQYIKKVDSVFSAVLGECTHELISRFRHKGAAYFAYGADCAVKPQPNDGCRAYSVTVSGIIDTPTSAIVRETIFRCSTKDKGRAS